MSLVRFALDFLAASLAANEPTGAGWDYLYDGHRRLSTIFAGVHGAPTPFQEGVAVPGRGVLRAAQAPGGRGSRRR